MKLRVNINLVVLASIFKNLYCLLVLVQLMAAASGEEQLAIVQKKLKKKVVQKFVVVENQAMIQHLHVNAICMNIMCQIKFDDIHI